MQTTKLIYKFTDVQEEVEHLKKVGITRGSFLGFQNLHEFYSFKDFGTTYLYGSPFSGKTEFWFDIMMSLTEFYGCKHVIYSPESGTASEIFAELLSKRCRKPFHKNLPNSITENEYLKEKDFINEYFFIVDPQDKDITIDTFYESVKKLEKDFEIKINTTCCDPFNELKHEFGEHGRQDLYIESKLGFIRRDAMTNKRHNVIITHVTDQEPIRTKENVTFYPPATPRQIAGGQAWYRKAMNLICVYRPTAGMIDTATGAPYEENEVHIIINKYKPKGVGKRGMVKLYFDTHSNRYYEKINGVNMFARPDQITMPNAQQLNYPY